MCAVHFSKKNQDGYRTENIPNVSKERIQLLKKTNFEDKLQEEFEELIVRIDEERGEILFGGPTDEVTDAIARYCTLDSEVTDMKLQFPPYILKVLNTNKASQAIKVEMAENEVDAVFVLEEDESTSRIVAAKEFHQNKRRRHTIFLGDLQQKPYLKSKIKILY